MLQQPGPGVDHTVSGYRPVLQPEVNMRHKCQNGDMRHKGSDKLVTSNMEAVLNLRHEGSAKFETRDMKTGTIRRNETN